MKGTDPSGRPLPGLDPAVDPPPETHRETAARYDPELDVRAILWSAAWLAGGVVAVCLLMYWLFLGLRRAENRADPPPPPLAEERTAQPLPPEPRLQASPDADMLALRSREDRTLHQPAWIDEKAGTVRLPIDLAMDVIARRGLAPTGAGGPTPDEQQVAAAKAAAAQPKPTKPGKTAAAKPAGSSPS